MIAHAAGAVALVLVLGGPTSQGLQRLPSVEDEPCVDTSRIVFLATDPRPGSGGGGGGNREPGPIRRAEGVGPDAITLRTSKPRALPATPPRTLPDNVPSVPSIVLDAAPLASGTFEQVGLPQMAAPGATSTGAGSGGGVGTGAGTGIGAGRGSGLGRGSGGGTGGGVFRPGGAVSAPRVITEVKPKYTNGALLRRIQGTVELEVVVTRDGLPSQIRVLRSLDPGGLDVEAVAAVEQWRFAPGRVAGEPVDVLVVILLDFWIR
jgi:protein TonB